MIQAAPSAFRWIRLAAGLLLAGLVGGLNAADRLDWDVQRQEVRAEIDRSTVQEVLAKVSAATGWQVYVDPEIQRTVSTRFRGLPPVEALRKLLGDLDFALVPQPVGPSKLFVYRGSVSDATQQIAAAPGKDDRIPNELIIRLKPDDTRDIHKLAGSLGAKVIGEIDELNAYRLSFEDEAAAERARKVLKEDEGIASIDNNYRVENPGSLRPLSTNPGGQPDLRSAPDARSLVIALIDTAAYGQGSLIGDFLLPGISIGGQAPSAPSDLTHGTAMAETILKALAGAAGTEGLNARILPVDVYGNNPMSSTFNIAQGIYAALEQKPSIFNLSLGGASESPFLRETIATLRQQGYVFVAAGGNDPSIVSYPAAWPEVTAVAASAGQGAVAPYSSSGNYIDVLAPGNSVVHYDGRAYLTTGTSSAAAYVTGRIAGLMLTTPGSTPSQAEAVIRKTMAFTPSANR